MHSFEEYLAQNNLEALTVAMAARVRYLTVYRATKGQPITLKDAETIRQVAYHLSGVTYKGVFAIYAIDEQPTVPLQRVPAKHT